VLQPAPQPVQKTVQIWRGGQMQEITFTEGQIRESLSATIVSDRSKPTVARPVSSRHQGPVAEPPVSSGRGDAETGNLPTPAPRPKTSASKKDCPSCNKGKSSQQPVYVTVETKGAGIEVGVQDN